MPTQFLCNKLLFIGYKQPGLAMNHTCWHGLFYQWIPSWDARYEFCSSFKMSKLFVHKWHWRPHAQLLFSHVKQTLQSWE